MTKDNSLDDGDLQTINQRNDLSYASQKPQEKFNLLVVDDEPLIIKQHTRFTRDVLQKLLGGAVNLNVNFFTDSEAAFHYLLQNEVPDAIISDFSMPVMTGNELLTKYFSHIQTIGLSLPTSILMSAAPDEQITRELKRKFGTIFVQKPFDVTKLCQTLFNDFSKKSDQNL